MSTFTHLNLLKDAGLENRFAQVKANDMHFNIKKKIKNQNSNKITHLYRNSEDFRRDL